MPARGAWTALACVAERALEEAERSEGREAGQLLEGRGPLAEAAALAVGLEGLARRLDEQLEERGGRPSGGVSCKLSWDWANGFARCDISGRPGDEELLSHTTREVLHELQRARPLTELEVTRDLCTVRGRLHGGAVMAFADTLGAYGAALNLPEGHGTTTLESKTNFFAAGVEGSTITGTATPIHLGRSTMVWQTRIEDADGKLVALVTQTQMVLAPAAANPT